MKPDLVTLETIGHVGLMRFNNPEELNTLHVPMLLAMEEALTLLECDANVRVIVVTGVGDRAFIAGGNINDLNARRGLRLLRQFSTAVTAAVTSIITLLLISDTETLNTFRFWQVGSLASRSLQPLTSLWPFLASGVVLALVVGRMLNLLSLGDDLARGLGQHLAAARVVTAVAVVLLCGSATALAGPIVFVGLVVPHVARFIVGPDYRWILAYSAVLGPVLPPEPPAPAPPSGSPWP